MGPDTTAFLALALEVIFCMNVVRHWDLLEEPFYRYDDIGRNINSEHYSYGIPSPGMPIWFPPSFMWKHLKMGLFRWIFNLSFELCWIGYWVVFSALRYSDLSLGNYIFSLMVYSQLLLVWCFCSVILWVQFFKKKFIVLELEMYFRFLIEMIPKSPWEKYCLQQVR